jgi:hypothetical protein
MAASGFGIHFGGRTQVSNGAKPGGTSNVPSPICPPCLDFRHLYQSEEGDPFPYLVRSA